MNIYTTSSRIAINNQSRFIPNKTSALLFSLICVLTLAACAGGGGDGGGSTPEGKPNPPPAGIGVLNLRVIPNDTNATLIWNNPDVNITSINITYHNKSTPDALQYFPLITEEDSISSNATNVTKVITNLEEGSIYIFNVRLELGGADENKTVNRELSETRLIGPNLDQDEYADADLLETDEDGDGVNDNLDAFPRNTTLSAFAVTELSARPGNGEVTLSWNNPVAEIASISISYQRDDFVGQLMMNSSAQITSGEQNVQETIEGLTNGQSYTFNVTLTLTGDDAAKKVMVASTTATPGAFSVIDLAASPGAGNVTLNWNNPDADIASISISYEVTGSGMSTTVGASNTGRGASVEQTITGLTNGQSYTFNISLTLQNDDAGREGMAVSDTATPNVFAVTDLTAIPNDSSVTLSWINPDADIASISISYYEVTGSGASTTVGASNIGREASVEETIDGLDNEVSYNFTVSLTLGGDIYAGREGPALSIIVGIGPNLDGDEYADFVDNDVDGDSFINADDVDDDGDGLIEIATAAQLDQIRYNLLGSSLNTSDGVAGDASGCGGLNDISECNGYELTHNISLDGYPNWVPIGSCGDFEGTGENPCTTVSSLFSTTFDGNGWTISNLTITNPAAPYNNAAGLFGAISPDSILRNVHIRSANISGGDSNVGLLVGYAQRARISNSSAEGEVMATVSGKKVGGLVGDGANANITSSYVTGGSISGLSSIGGLIGAGNFAVITSSYAMNITVLSDNNNAGGLVGAGNFAIITSSYVVGGSVIGLDRVGGMAGNGESSTKITLSYVGDLFISGRSNIGGMVGGGNSIITSSYVGGGVDIIGTGRNIGGMIGSGDGATIKSSYVAADTISGTSHFGGILGFGTLNAASSNSYWNNETSGITGGSVAGKSEGKTTDELRMPKMFAGSIYATWEDDMCGGDDDSIAWDLGNSTQYPALNCTPGGKDAQRP